MKVQNESSSVIEVAGTRISVIMPAFNCEKYISKSIDSVLHQTHKNWELIIVDDNSSDNTASIASEYAKKDSRIRVINQIPNAGCAQARNLGISEAKGKYIAFLDSDDMWVAEKLEKQLNLLSKKMEAPLSVFVSCFHLGVSGPAGWPDGGPAKCV